MKMNRRSFVRNSALLAATASGAGCAERLSEEAALALKPGTAADTSELFFKISLAEWSLHRTLWAGEMDHLDFATKAREFGVDGIEYVTQFFADKAEDTGYLDQMNQRAKDNGVSQILIMVDGEGSLAGNSEVARIKAVENHYKWVRAAKHLGCHTVRVNAQGKGVAEEVAARAIDSLSTLAEYAAQENINVVVENHGGYSSDAQWLSGVMRQVNLPNCGTLPDFGNFTMNLFPLQKYDRYLGVEELMPWAKGVSAKTHDFEPDGLESDMDYDRLLGIVRDAGYRGYIGIEYEGTRLSETAGILATKALLVNRGRRL